jgi:hypothetical protein
MITRGARSFAPANVTTSRPISRWVGNVTQPLRVTYLSLFPLTLLAVIVFNRTLILTS